ncbi:MAG: cation:proton antiporter [Desulfitibacter sp. BRH_c19]|nr:MAG: cation:proton antiporter [Desulfitibacter sp. BRH_c19]
MHVFIIEIVLLILAIVTGIVALSAKDLLASVILFSAFSYFVALIYLIVGAADVAFTEAVIGVVSTVFFVSALNNLKRRCS